MLERVQVAFGMFAFPKELNAWLRWVKHLKHSQSICVRLWFAAVAGLMYRVRKERNRRIFTLRTLDAKELASVIVREVKCWLKAMNVTSKSERDRVFLRSIC